MAQDAGAPIVALDLEITVVGSKPAVGDGEHLDPPVSQEEAPGRLLAPVPGIALDRDYQSRLYARFLSCGSRGSPSEAEVAFTRGSPPRG